jgi:hypothetical protein
MEKTTIRRHLGKSVSFESLCVCVALAAITINFKISVTSHNRSYFSDKNLKQMFLICGRLFSLK